jgi:hypothetical protein
MAAHGRAQHPAESRLATDTRLSFLRAVLLADLMTMLIGDSRTSSANGGLGRRE